MNDEVYIFQEYATGFLGDGTQAMTEEDFIRLMDDGLATPKRIEHIKIKIEFKKLRKLKMRSGKAIEELSKEFPHLQFDTIRKIIYDTNYYNRVRSK